jgi:hypothetical protein
MVSAALPTTRIAVMPGQQHVAMDTAPELFLNAVIGFLSGQGAAAGTAPSRPNRPPS